MCKRKTLIFTALVLLPLAAATAAAAATLSGTVEATGMRHDGDAVVYVDTIAGAELDPPAEPVQMDQEQMEFIPHVLPVLVGTTVEFLNSDAVLHNVFTPDKCAGRFNLGSWPQGETRSYTFEKPCVAALLCNVHPEMEAFVVAVPTPYFAVSGRDGSYAIEGLPDGEYTVKVWHPKLPETSRSVTVAGDTAADFELKK